MQTPHTILCAVSISLLAACSPAPNGSDGAVNDVPSNSGFDASADASPIPTDTAIDTPSTPTESGVPSAYNQLWIPPTLTGTTFDLTLSPSTKQLQTGAPTTTYAFNGENFWGPTLIMNRGDMVQMHVNNRLSETTTTHWHGFHIPAEMDGGPHQLIPAGTTWSPRFVVNNNAGTYWYHPHLHHLTQAQLTRGAGGLIIIRDPAEAALALPRTYGVDDLPLVLTSRRFEANNQFALTGAYGDYMLSNGTMRAEVTLPRQFVRVRILNAEMERTYNLGFSDNRMFYVIGNDGGLLSAPVGVTRLPLYVGERAEILVDLSADAVGASLDLQAYNSGQARDYPGGEPGRTGMFGSLLNNTTFKVLHINVGASTANPINRLPASLVTNTFWTDAQVTNSRTLRITDMGPGTPFTFDGVGYAENTVNHRVALNAVERWTITNTQTFSHSFHIHDVQFHIVSRSGGAVAAYEQGWKDVVSIPTNSSVTFIAKFEDFASATMPYMYHCHMSNHEDEGLMGQFLVQ